MSALQSVVFLHPPWRIDTAKNRFKKMGHVLKKGKKIDVVRSKSTNKILQYRFRVRSPTKFKRFITKRILNDTVLLIIGFI